jgi:uncharacterized protein YgiM (DUF1202 family)
MMKILAISIALFVVTFTNGTASTRHDDSKMAIAPIVADSSCNRWGEVNTAKDPLSIRVKPSQNANVIAKVPKGASVCILSVYDDNWYKVKYKSITGYAASAYIKG